MGTSASEDIQSESTKCHTALALAGLYFIVPATYSAGGGSATFWYGTGLGLAQQSFGEQLNPGNHLRKGHNIKTIPRQPSSVKSPQSTQDHSSTKSLSDYLHRNYLPLVGAQVLLDPTGKRRVILYGYVATEKGDSEAVEKTRQFLGNSDVEVENRIIVQPQLYPGPTVPSESSVDTELPSPFHLGSPGVPRAVVGCWEGQEIIDSCEVVSGPPVAAFTPASYRLCYQIKDSNHSEITLANSNLNPSQIVWTGSLLGRLFQHTTMNNIDTRTEIISSDERGNVKFRSFYHFDEHDAAFVLLSEHSSHEGVQTLDCQVWPKSLRCTIETQESSNQYNPWTECHSHADLNKTPG